MRHYAARRYQRVFPLYLVSFAATLALVLVSGHGLPNTYELISSATLLPVLPSVVVTGSWTLQHEMGFYLCFGAAIASRRLAVLIIAAWVTAFVLHHTTGFWPTMPERLAAMYNLEFVAGLMAALWLRLSPATVPRWTLAAGVVGFMAAGAAEGTGAMNGYADPARLAYGLPSFLLILGAASRPGLRPGLVMRVLTGLGAASYSIYLFQFLFIALVWHVWTHLPVVRDLNPLAAFPVLSLSTILGGCMVSLVCEYPLLALHRSRMG